MAVQVSVRLTGKVTFVETISCVTVGATAEEKEEIKHGEVATTYVDHVCSVWEVRDKDPSRSLQYSVVTHSHHVCLPIPVPNAAAHTNH